MNERAEQTNDVLGKLTILGTIVLPMNIVTGLFGSNFPVPVSLPSRAYLNIYCIFGIEFFIAFSRPKPVPVLVLDIIVFIVMADARQQGQTSDEDDLSWFWATTAFLALFGIICYFSARRIYGPL